MRKVVDGCFAASCLVVSLAACSPLPGASLDPLYLKRPPAAAPAGPAAPSPASARAAVSEPTRGAVSTWTGHYRDSRGEGELTLSLVRNQRGLTGTWRMRTGGAGGLTAVAEADGARLKLHMESPASDCPAELDGWAELGDALFVGAYHGKDCEGPVSDGRFDVRPR